MNAQLLVQWVGSVKISSCSVIFLTIITSHFGLFTPLEARANPEKGSGIVTELSRMRAQIWHGDEMVYFGRFSADGHLVATLTSIGMKIWTTTGGQVQREIKLSAFFKDEWPNLHGASLSPDLQRMVVIKDQDLHCFDFSTGSLFWRYRLPKEPIKALFAWSKGGHRLIVGGEYLSTAYVLDAQSGSSLAEISTESPSSFALSPEGRFAFIGKNDGGELYEVDSNKKLFRISRDEISFGAEFTPDGSAFATAMGSGEACLWSVKSGLLIRCFEGHQELLTTVAFSPDGELLASSGYQGKILIHDVATGVIMHELEGHEKNTTHLEFSRTGSLLLSTSMDQRARIWSVESSKNLAKKGKPDRTQALDQDPRSIARSPRMTLRLGHSPSVSSSAFSIDEQLLFLGGEDGVLSIIHAQSGRLIRRLSAYSGMSPEITSISPDPQGELVWTGSSEGVRAWEIKSGALKVSIETNHEVNAIYLPKGSSIFIVTGGQIIEWSRDGARALRWLGNREGRPFDLDIMASDFQPKKALIYLVRRNLEVEELNLKTGELKPLFKVSAPAFSLKLSRDGRSVFLGVRDHVERWSIKKKSLISRWKTALNSQLWTMDVAPDGKRIAVAGNGGNLEVFDLQKGHVTWSHQAGEENDISGYKSFKHQSVTTVAFSPSSAQLLFGGEGSNTHSGLAELRKARSGKLIHQLRGQIASADSARFTRAGDGIIVRSGPRSSVWSLKSGEEVIRFSQDTLRPIPLYELDEAEYLTLSDGNQLQIHHLPTRKIERFTHHMGQTGRMNLISPTKDLKRVLVNEIEVIKGISKLVLRSRDQWESPLAEVNVESSISHHLITSHDHDQVVLFDSESVKVWSTHDLSLLYDVKFSESLVGFDQGLISVDGQHLILSKGLKDRPYFEVKIIEIPTGRLKQSFTPLDQGQGVYYLTFPDSQGAVHVIRTVQNGVFNWMNWSTGEEKVSFIGDVGHISCAMISPDQKFLATAGENFVISLWDLSTGRRLNQLNYHSARVNSLAFSQDGTRLISASRDGTVTLWDLKTGRRHASLFSFTEGGWAVVSPEGRFDTNTPRSLPAVSWIIPDDPLSPLPFEIFLREYFEPRLLVRSLEGEQFPSIRDISELNLSQPLVKITSIRPSRSQKHTVDVIVEAKSIRGRRGYSGVRDLKLFRDGHQVGSSLEESESHLKGNQSKKITFRDIQIPAGVQPQELTFSAYAFNEDSVKGPDAQQEYTTPAVKPARLARAYVISIGVNHHSNPSWNLSYSAADARALRESLQSHLKTLGHFDTVRAIELISDRESSEHNAKREAIIAALKALAGAAPSKQLLGHYPQLEQIEKAHPEDLVVLYFAGHGYAGEGGLFHIFPEDIGEGTSRIVDDELLKRSLNSDQLSDLLRDVDSGEFLFIIDACNSAASVEGDGFKPGPMGSRSLGQLAYNKGMRILTATQAENVAVESDKIGHGLLTYALIEDGLTLKQADFAPQDQAVFLGEWLQFGVERVPALFDELKRGQLTGSRGVVRLNEAGEMIKAKRRDLTQRPRLFDFIQGEKGHLLTRF